MSDQKHEIKRAINSVIRKKGRFPNLVDMCDVLSYTKGQTRKYMQALAEDGYLEKIGSWYKFSDVYLKEDERAEEEIVETEFPSEGIEIEYPIEGVIYKEKVPLSVREIVESVLNEEKVDSEMEIVGFDNPGKIKRSFSGIKNAIKGLGIKKPELNVNFTADTRGIEKALAGIKRKKKVQDVAVYGMPVYIIQVLMGVIGTGAAVISVYYTTIWLVEFLPWGFALLLSSIMVGFSIAAFEASILFLSGQVTENRVSKISVVAGMFLLWIVVSFFSIMSTVAGQYNKHIFNLRGTTEQSRNTDRMKWNILQEKKAEIKERLVDYKKQMSVFNNIMAGMNDVSSRTKNNGVWYESQYKLKQVNKKIVQLNKSMDVVRTEEKKFLDQSKETGLLLDPGAKKKTKNFYSWLAGVTGIVQDKVQFGMSLFPAIFVDLIAPIGIAMSLFLRNKYKK